MRNPNEAKDRIERWFRDNEENIEMVHYDDHSNALFIDHSGEYSVRVGSNTLSIKEVEE